MAVRRWFHPHPSAATEARHFVARILRDDANGDLALATSELATNAIRHAGSPFTVRVSNLGDVVRLEVFDESTVIPTPEGPREESLGLRILDAIADRWGAEPREEGKIVWAEFRLPSQQPDDAPHLLGS